MNDIPRYVVSFLPAELQHLYANPPSLTNPSAFLPLARLLLPLSRYVVVLLAFYIVWSTIAGVFGYFTRFARFAIRVGPIIGLLGWLMAASGQGSMPELFEAAKQWTGLSPRTTGAQAPGIASLAKLFEGGQKKPRTRTQSKKKNQEPDVLSSVLDSAAGYLSGDKDSDWIQSYVKDAIAKASGLDWLFSSPPEKKKSKRS